MKQKNDMIKKRVEEARGKLLNLGPVKIILLCLLLAATVISFVFYNDILGAETVFTKEYDSDFLNAVMPVIPLIVRCVQFITVAVALQLILIGIISVTFNRTRRSRTVARLICSIIKWITMIFSLIYILSVCGVNTAAIITGAGVLTLVVGLGMQSLIADVVAGLFIVFENEFNIGDIITVDGFRGEVVSMGIRTLKLKALGNVMIFNNSDVRKVLNQTAEPSVAKILVDIEYGENIGRVEGIIEKCLPELQIQGVIGFVSYDGVNSLGASGVQLQFTAQCHEEDVYKVQRLMNREIKNMFDENGINIPFPQIVVHNS